MSSPVLLYKDATTHLSELVAACCCCPPFFLAVVEAVTNGKGDTWACHVRWLLLSRLACLRHALPRPCACQLSDQWNDHAPSALDPMRLISRINSLTCETSARTQPQRQPCSLRGHSVLRACPNRLHLFRPHHFGKGKMSFKGVLCSAH